MIQRRGSRPAGRTRVERRSLRTCSHIVVSGMPMGCALNPTEQRLCVNAHEHVAGHVIFGWDPIWVSSTLFILTYAAIVSERVNRAIVSLVGAGLMISLGVLNQETAIRGGGFQHPRAADGNDGDRVKEREAITDVPLLKKSLAVLGLVMVAFVFAHPLRLEPATIAMSGRGAPAAGHEMMLMSIVIASVYVYVRYL